MALRSPELQVAVLGSGQAPVSIVCRDTASCFQIPLRLPAKALILRTMSSTLLHRVYYKAKPWLPRGFRHAVRGRHARWKRSQVAHNWPIFPGSEKPPKWFSGWPGGRQFAFVLTHDVEGQSGLDKCRQVMEIEKRHGFRSCFNFIPEGQYQVPCDFRRELIEEGFEVGVHDLRHDGSLFQSRSSFRRQAVSINNYLQEWEAVGFRAGFMFHNLEWIHDLEVDYDSSTFDTDPFEPQDDGVGTIFPFWVGDGAGNGYVELPYTLTQDGTLFLLLQERSTSVWDHKLDWIVKNRGMVLLDTHPDYFGLGPRAEKGTFPAALYENLLARVKREYDGQFWHALPREVAQFVRDQHAGQLDGVSTGGNVATVSSTQTQKTEETIWIDLENTPHIPFFKPIIEQLRSRGCRVVLTARDAYQTCEMAEMYGFEFARIGRHYGKSRPMKLLGLFNRSAQLVPFVLHERPALALNHGSRTQNLACNLLGVPTVTIMDYEHSQTVPLVNPRWEIVPRVVGYNNAHSRHAGTVLRYNGIKEEVYVPDFQPDGAIIQQLGLDPSRVIAVVRPPATEAHYHNPESEKLFVTFMERVCRSGDVTAVLLPRNKTQQSNLQTHYPEWFRDSKVIIPQQVVDGLNLLWHSDLAVSGGGTMNREAAALGVPVYSIFRGQIGAVDRYLEAEGRLTLVRSKEDVERKIHLRRRERTQQFGNTSHAVLNEVVNHIEKILKVYTAR